MLFALVPALFAATVTLAPEPPELRREALMHALRSGGYTVILRHARTDRSVQEPRDYVPAERSSQRNLSDDGIRDAALMGAVFRRYGVTFAEVLASPTYRTVETAEMAARAPDTTMALRLIPSTPDQEALVKRAPAPGTNRLIVTHHFVIETHVPGIRLGDIAESEAVVVRHVNGGVELVGRILLDDWRYLANPAGAAAATSAADAGARTHAASPAPQQSASSADPVSLPDTHAGHLARDYLEAFNSGSRDTMRRFIESSMQPSADRTMDQRLDNYTSLFNRLGSLAVHMVVESQATEIVLAAGSRAGIVRMTLKSSEGQPMRVSSITFALPGGHP